MRNSGKFNYKMKVFKNIFLLGPVITLLTLLFAACTPPKTPKLIVTCLDSAGSPVAGAAVTILTQGTVGGVTKKGIVSDQGTSGSDGTIRFEFKLPLVATVKATKPIAGRDTIKGANAQFCDWDKTAETTVKMRRK